MELNQKEDRPVVFSLMKPYLGCGHNLVRITESVFLGNFQMGRITVLALSGLTKKDNPQNRKKNLKKVNRNGKERTSTGVIKYVLRNMILNYY